VIDLHSHILPAIDDGPATMEVSLDMAQRALAEGIGTMVATPHVNLRYPDGLEEIGQRLESLRDALSRARIGLRVLPGAEVAVPRLPDLTEDEVRRLVIADGPYLLLESPLAPDGAPVEPAVQQLHALGLRAVLAHPERSPDFQRSPERLQQLVDEGALCAINVGSLGRRFGSGSRQLAVWLLERGLVHCVASDAHDAGRRSPALTTGFEEVARELPEFARHADWYTRVAPAAVIAGEELPGPPPAPRRAKTAWWRRLRR